VTGVTGRVIGTGHHPRAMNRTVVWHDRDALASERCLLRAEPGGFRFDGVVVGAADGAPMFVEYVVRVDLAWRTRRVEARVNGGGGKDTRILIADAAGAWWADGKPIVELQGCLDVELAITPSTCTLLIHRLLLQEEQSQTVDVAWLRFPSLEVVRGARRYTRKGARNYTVLRVASALGGDVDGAEDDLDIDDDGLTIAYRSFRRIAHA